MQSEDRHALTACIDWLSLTVMDLSFEEICEKLLKIPIHLMRDDLGSGIRGYRAFKKSDDIRVLEGGGKATDLHYHVLLTGKGCRQFETWLEGRNETWFDFLKDAMKYASNVPRLDLAIDDKRTYFDIKDIIEMAENQECISKLRAGVDYGKFNLSDGKREGRTISFGSRESLLYIVFYEKNYEQAEKLNLTDEEMEEMLSQSWNRYELRFRQEKAVATVKELLQHQDVSKVALGTLHYNMRFAQRNPNDSTKSRWKTYPFWEKFMEDIKSIRLVMNPKQKDYMQLFWWIKHFIAPSLKIMKSIDNIVGGDNLTMLIDNAKLTPKHKDMIEDYAIQYFRNSEMDKDTIAMKVQKEFQESEYLNLQASAQEFIELGKRQDLLQLQELINEKLIG